MGGKRVQPTGHYEVADHPIRQGAAEYLLAP